MKSKISVFSVLFWGVENLGTKHTWEHTRTMNLSGEQKIGISLRNAADILMKPNILGDFAQAKYGTKREGTPAARVLIGPKERVRTS